MNCSNNKLCWQANLLMVIGFLFFAFLAEGQIIRTIDWTSFPDTGRIEANEMKLFGGFDYVQRGFGNGPESNHNAAYNLSLYDDLAGVNSGRWAKVLSRKWPGPNTVHTFGKSIRAVNLGLATPFSYDEVWIDLPLWIPYEWITHNQGKLGHSLSNPFGTSPGTNPTDSFEFLFHYFSCHTAKKNNSQAPWYSENPIGPFQEQDMLIGLDVYANDVRINTHFSEPIFFKESISSTVRKVFKNNTHYILRAHIKLNSPGDKNGVLAGWFSEDGGSTWTKSVEVTDFDWRGDRNFNFEQEGFVAFRGGNGHGFEVGGDSSVSQNTGAYNPPQDTWYFIGKIDLYDEDPFVLLNNNALQSTSAQALSCRPNPSAGLVQLYADGFVFDDDYKILVYERKGKLVDKLSITSSGNVDFSHLLNGIYFLTIIKNGQLVAQFTIELVH